MNVKVNRKNALSTKLCVETAAISVLKKKKIKRKTCTCFIKDTTRGHFDFGEFDPNRVKEKLL